MQASERQFHTLADSIPQLVWMADAQGAIYWLNNHWYEYTGRPAGEVNPHGWQAILGHRWIEALQAGVALEAELSLLGKDGQYRPFLTRIVPLRDSSGTVYGWIGTHIDISERKRGEREVHRAKDAAEAALRHLRETQNSLIEAEKLAALGRLVAGVAHEINNPLGTSLTVASSLERKCSLFAAEAALGTLKRSSLNDFIDAVQDASEQLLVSLNRAAGLVQSFKQVAADRNNSDLRSFDIGDLTEQLAVGLRPALPKHGVSLNVQCQPNLSMNSYPGSYGQVLTNLFLNSIAHAFPDARKGTIDIKVSASGVNDVEIVFTDDGCGMSPDVRRQAFDPFFTTRRHQGGTGLGLHIVHSIVIDRLGGRLDLRSEPAKGTRVRLVLPRTAPATPGVTAATS
ncbi:MAG TPA: ATP-binding protein [Bradyrhizobium sp.]|nr:ATP-binding protein [Bradyrhizobium sp.]